MIFDRMIVRLTPVLTRDNMMRSLSARVSPCFILIRFLSRHFMAYIFPVSAFRQPYTSPKPPLPIIRCTLKSFIVSCKNNSRNVLTLGVLSKEKPTTGPKADNWPIQHPLITSKYCPKTVFHTKKWTVGRDRKRLK